MQEQRIQKQMGCMSGFLQIFDRHVAGNRLSSTKRLTTSTSAAESPEHENDVESALKSRYEILPTEPQPKSPKPLPILQFKEGTISTKRRLKPVTDDIERRNQSGKCRSTSIIVKLMGLESLPASDSSPDRTKKPELRRSVSDSGISSDHHQHQYINHVDSRFNRSHSQQDYSNNNPIKASRRKSFVDMSDYYPQRKQTATVSSCNEIERRLRKRGIEKQSRDLETLKQILEAMQLKGLLRSSNSRNFVYDARSLPKDESPIIIMKPRSTSLVKSSRRSESNETTMCSVETQRRACNESMEPKRVPSPVQSPKVGSRKTGIDHNVKRSNVNKRSTVRIYQMEHNEIERFKEYKEGRNLLDRCDKLLHSIEEMNAASELQPSPLSVLDSSFYKEDSSLSPVSKRSIDWNDDETWSPAAAEGVEESNSEEKLDECDFIYVSSILTAFKYLSSESDLFMLLEKQQELKGNDTSKESKLERKLKFDTIVEILNRKKQLPPWKLISSSNSIRFQNLSQQIWLEFRRIQRKVVSDDLFEVICNVLKKDLYEDDSDGWSDCFVEVAESVLGIERLIFKDLICEVIGDLACLARKCVGVSVLRRKLIF